MIRPLDIPTSTPTQAGEAYASARERCFAYLETIRLRLTEALDAIDADECTWAQSGEVERLAEELRQAKRIADLHLEAAINRALRF
jgi:hypothetical protein